MATFVLVPGAWRGSWLWARVRKRLQANGHEVLTPTLTGLADRSHLLTREVNLETHIQDVVNLIEWEGLADVVLCGHSYAGAVISGVAERIPDRIAALVYLDAFVLENGECVHDTLPSAHRDLQVKAAERDGQGWQVPPIPAEAFNVNANDRDWVNRQCTPQPLATFQQAVKLSGKSESVNRATYILTTDLPDSPFPPFYERAKAKGWKMLTIATGHDAMLDQPEELTRLLTDAAAV
jgi:pimeloyl-ACP methyl ester carboxylesterase